VTNPIPRVAIVVLNWNSWRDTLVCLNSVLAIDYPNYDVIAVDNGSADGSVGEIKSWLNNRRTPYSVLLYTQATRGGMDKGRVGLANTGIVIIEVGQNLGYTGGNNVGIRCGLERGADYILVLNEDTKVSKSFLSKMVATAEKEPTIGLVGCKILDLEEPSKVQYQGGNLNYSLGVLGQFRNSTEASKGGEEEVNFIPGCALLIKRAVLERVGLLEESYFLYGDDVEFVYRALEGGWRARVNLDAVIWHRQVPGRGKRSLGYYYYGTRNILYFTSKHLHGWQKISCLLFFIGGRLWLCLQWLLIGSYEHLSATGLGTIDYFRGVTGPKNTPLARNDERVRSSDWCR